MPVSVTIQDDSLPSNSTVIKARFNKAAGTYNETNMIGQEIANRLVERLTDLKRNFNTILNLGAGTGYMTQILEQRFPHAHITQADIAENMLAQAPNTAKVIMDANEAFPFEANQFDLVISNLLLPFLTDAPQALFRIGQTLQKDGLVHATTLGYESFKELRHAFAQAEDALGITPCAHTMPYPDVQAVGKAMQTIGYALPVVDKDILIIEYPDVYTLLTDLKMLGATCVHPQSQKGLTTPRFLQKVADIYTKEFALDDGSIPVTIEVIYIHGFKPDRTKQPQPLSPGSAQTSLADILKKA